jgi:hypothetical protein
VTNVGVEMPACLRLQRRGAWIRLVYALCLAGATINHLRSLLADGWLPDHLPIANALYWSSLTLLDPLAAGLLLLRPRVGVALTVIIISTNVAHNLWFVAAHPMRGSLVEDVVSNPFLLSQIAFLLFVAATARMAWPQRR